MRVLVASTGGTGHLTPLVPFVDGLRRRRADVLLVVPPELRATVEAMGVPFRLGADPDPAEAGVIRRRLATAPPDEAAILGNRDLFGRLCTAAMLPAQEAAFREWDPDLVVREPCEYASAVVAERSGVPHVQVAISMAEIEASALALVAPALQPYGAGVVAGLRASAYLTRMPESLDPSPWPATHRYREQVGTRSSALPDWWPGRGGPLVYLTFGTVTGGLPVAGGVYRAALDAVAGIRARVLLTVGRSFDIAALGPMPANVHAEAWVPQPDVLAEAALVVCHGGSGTTFGALAAGVPLVVVPLFADQSANGRRIAAAGTGLVVQPAHDVRPADDVGPAEGVSPAHAVGPAEGVSPAHDVRPAEGVSPAHDVRPAEGVSPAHDVRPAHDVGPAAVARAIFGAQEGPALTAAIEAVLGNPSFRRAAELVAAEIGSQPTIDELLDGDLIGPAGGRLGDG